MAYDTIMVFQDQFKNHILPDKVHMLNVSFLVPSMRREFGGCAGNIAYNLHLLGGDGKPMAAVGQDFEPYKQWFNKLGICMDHVKVLEDEFTPQCYITTDLDNNQITAFHPGAMGRSHENHVRDATGISIGLVGPDGRDGMIQNAKQFNECGIPFVFDPGQAMPLFSGDEFKTFIEQADYVVVNDYESSLLKTRTGWSDEEIASKVKAYIVTQGPEGALIHTNGEVIDIPAAKEEAIKDPTGCGDAFRAGLLYGLMNGHDWPTTGRMASLMGALKIAHHGTQNQSFTFDEFAAEFEKQFGYGV